MVTFFTGGGSNNRRSFVLRKFLKQYYNATVNIRYTLEVITLNVYVFCVIICILNLSLTACNRDTTQKLPFGVNTTIELQIVKATCDSVCPVAQSV